MLDTMTIHRGRGRRPLRTDYQTDRNALVRPDISIIHLLQLAGKSIWSTIILRCSEDIISEINKKAMFQKSDEAMRGAETIIGPSVKVDGDLNATGNVIIEGSVNGNISTDKDITIGVAADIVADVKATNATISGKVKGSMEIEGHLNIKSSAKINGDIKTATISIESGAQINGMLNMGGAQSAAAPTKEPAEAKEEAEK